MNFVEAIAAAAAGTPVRLPDWTPGYRGLVVVADPQNPQRREIKMWVKSGQHVEWKPEAGQILRTDWGPYTEPEAVAKPRPGKTPVKAKAA